KGVFPVPRPKVFAGHGFSRHPAAHPGGMRGIPPGSPPARAPQPVIDAPRLLVEQVAAWEVRLAALAVMDREFDRLLPVERLDHAVAEAEPPGEVGKGDLVAAGITQDMLEPALAEARQRGGVVTAQEEMPLDQPGVPGHPLAPVGPLAFLQYPVVVEAV